jgi:UPF0755 protein
VKTASLYSSLQAYVPYALLGILVAGMVVNLSLQSPLSLENEVEIEIPPGASATAVMETLMAQGMIDTKLPMRIRMKLLNLEGSLQAGVYAVRQGDTAESVINKILVGDSKLFSVTLVEGKRARDYIEQLKQTEGIIQTDIDVDASIKSFGIDFPNCGFQSQHIEGRFYPDTYFFSPGTKDIQILKRAALKMCETLTGAWVSRTTKLPYSSMYEGLILASIIEKESNLIDEVEIISGVFARRLSLGMRIQADPTVVYGRGENRSGVLTKEDLQKDTPYNTYTRPGLPLTPIANPSKISISAAFNPRPGNELYFVAKGDGRHHFSAGLEEHQMAVNKYRQGSYR